MSIEVNDGFLVKVFGPNEAEDAWTIMAPHITMNATRDELFQLRYAIGRALESGDSEVDGGLDGCTMVVRVRVRP